MTRCLHTVCWLVLMCVQGASAADLRVGFGEVDITPKLEQGKPVYLAGYGHNRQAVGVHDPIMLRAVVLADGRSKIALICADVVGLMRPTVQAIRGKIAGFDYVMVASTHNHEGPDTIGLWGSSPLVSGVDAGYMKRLVEKAVEAVKLAEKNLTPVKASYGVAADESILGDSRLPKAFDGVLRVLRFDRIDTGMPYGLLVQWNCHPEAMGSKNKQITADFPHATVAALKKKHGCAVAYFSGAVGGLMAPPDHVVKNGEGRELKEGDFEYCRVYGEMVASLAEKAIAGAAPIALTPMKASAKVVNVPLTNPIYMAMRKLGVVQRDAFVWTGDADKRGEPYDDENSTKQPAIEAEVACLTLGALSIACIPGEIYPELIYGKFQEPAEADADFPNAEKEKHLTAMFPADRKLLIIGLANDEIGYIIPKRQWDAQAPFAYGRNRAQYGEVNSVGPDAAPILMKALEEVSR